MMNKYKFYVNSINGNGNRTEVECPRKKCTGEVLYNGNYFCNTCDWVMPDNSKKFLKTCLTGLRDCAIKAGRTEYAERCEYYLNND